MAGKAQAASYAPRQMCSKDEYRMNLRVEPPVLLASFDSDLELVVCIGAERPPEILTDRGQPKPDRHLLLGIVQSLVMAVEERDEDLVAFHGWRTISLNVDGQSRELACDMLIFRTMNGRIGAVAPEDVAVARSLARKALRWFTGTIRLDVP
jgi:hypothetical protein